MPTKRSTCCKYQPQRGARLLEKVLKSAWATPRIAGRRASADLVVVDARVDGGPMFKRIRPRARGMAFMIKRRMAHIHVSVDTVSLAGSSIDPLIAGGGKRQNCQRTFQARNETS